MFNVTRLDKIIMDLFMTKIKFDNKLFSKIQDSNVVLYKGSIQDHMWKRATQDIL